MSAVQLKAGRVAELPLSAVLPDPDQPRREFSKPALTALADSIKARGVQVPLLIRKTEAGKFMLIDGERRLRAAREAGLKKVPVLLRDSDDDPAQIRIDQTMLNLQRETLTAMEQARMLGDLQAREKLSANEIAARMAKAGMKLSKQEIEQRTKLLELPSWAQDMIDREELDAAGGLALLPAMKPHPLQPKIAAAARKNLEQRVGYSGQVKPREVSESVERAMLSVGVDLSRTGEWYGKDAVHFDWKKACTGCEHLRRFSHGAACLSPSEFKKRNDEAKAAGLLPGGRRPKADAKSPSQQAVAEAMQEERQERRAQSRSQRVAEYFDGWLRAEVLAAVATDAHGKLASRLAAYYAAGMPRPNPLDFGDDETGVELGLHSYANRLRVNAGQAVLREDLTRRSLASFLEGEPSWGETLTIAQACLTSLEPHEVKTVAFWAQIDVPARSRVTAPYLELKRKAELLELAAQAGIDEPPAGIKVTRLKEVLLAPAIVEAIGMPADLRAVWERPDDVTEPDDQDDVEDLDDAGDEGDDADLEDAA